MSFGQFRRSTETVCEDDTRITQLHNAAVGLEKKDSQKSSPAAIRDVGAFGRRGSTLILEGMHGRQARVPARISLDHISTKEKIHLRKVYDAVVKTDCDVTPHRIAALLHRANVCVVPNNSELSRMITKVSSAFTQRRYNTGAPRDMIETGAAPLSFEVFLQVTELCKRYSNRAADKQDDCNDAFTNLVQYGKAIKKGTIMLDRQRTSLQSTGHTNVTDDTNSNVDDTASNAASTQAGSYRSGTINVKLLNELMLRIGVSYDFQTLFDAVDPTFDEHVTMKQFRWAAGTEDPAIVKAFVALGGEPDLSGTIPLDTLIAKCNAMGMTRQYIANFMAEVDANNDGVVDYNEFLAMVVRSRDEREDAMGLQRAWSVRQPRVSITGEKPEPSQFPRRQNFRRQSLVSPSAPPGLSAATRMSSESMVTQQEPSGPFQREMRSIFLDNESVESEMGAESEEYTAFAESDGEETSTEPSESSSLPPSDSEDDSGATKGTPRRKSEAHHLKGINFEGLLNNADQSSSTIAATKTDRINAVVSKGKETAALQRSKWNKYLESTATEKPKRFVHTDYGLIDADTKHKGVLSQRQVLRIKKEMSGRKRSVSPRVQAVPAHKIDQLRKQALMALEENKVLEESAAQRQKMKELHQQRLERERAKKTAAAAMAIVACASMEYVASVLHVDPIILGDVELARHAIKFKKHYAKSPIQQPFRDAKTLTIDDSHTETKKAVEHKEVVSVFQEAAELAEAPDTPNPTISTFREDSSSDSDFGDLHEQKTTVVALPSDQPDSSEPTEEYDSDFEDIREAEEESQSVGRVMAAMQIVAAAAMSGAMMQSTMKLARQKGQTKKKRPATAGVRTTRAADLRAKGTTPRPPTPREDQQRDFRMYSQPLSRAGSRAGSRANKAAALKLKTPCDVYSEYLETVLIPPVVDTVEPTTKERHQRSRTRCEHCTKSDENATLMAPKKPQRPSTAGTRRPPRSL